MNKHVHRGASLLIMELFVFLVKVECTACLLTKHYLNIFLVEEKDILSFKRKMWTALKAYNKISKSVLFGILMIYIYKTE